MNNIKFQINGNITQNNLRGNNNIELSGEIKPLDDKAATDKKIEKQSSYIKRKWDVIKNNKKVFGYWLIVILLGTDICCHISYNCVIENINYLFAIIGIIATFIVVSNYAQVKEIKDEFDKRTKKIEGDAQKAFDNVALDINNQKNEILANSMYMLGNSLFDSNKEQCMIYCYIVSFDLFKKLGKEKKYEHSTEECLKNIYKIITEKDSSPFKVLKNTKIFYLESLTKIDNSDDRKQNIINFINNLKEI